MLARRLWAYGTEVAYFSDSSTCIGFTRFGHPSQSGGAGLAVVINTAWRCDTKRMCVGRRHAGERWTDVLEQVCGEVLVDETGHGTFSTGPRGVTVWVNKEAEGRKVVDPFVLSVCISLISAYSPPLSWAAKLSKTGTQYQIVD
jgi:alpha-amylase